MKTTYVKLDYIIFNDIVVLMSSSAICENYWFAILSNETRRQKKISIFNLLVNILGFCRTNRIKQVKTCKHAQLKPSIFILQIKP